MMGVGGRWGMVEADDGGWWKRMMGYGGRDDGGWWKLMMGDGGS